MYLAYNITRNCFEAVHACSDSYTSSKEALVNNSSDITFPVFKYLNIYVPKSTMGVVDPLKGPSSALMPCSENLRFNPNSVNIYYPKIISYPPLAESSI